MSAAPRNPGLCAAGCVLLAWMTMAPSTTSAATEYLDWAFTPESYAQELVVTFADESAAAAAAPAIEPLFDGCARAVSNRWDDNIPQNVTARDLLARHDLFSTFYLNSNTVSYLNGADYRPIARELLRGGSSIGGHGSSHPYITWVHRNRMFEEMAAVRIEWEAALDTQVVSYAFSFIDFHNEAEPEASQRDVIRSLERAGYYHVASNPTFQDRLPSAMVFSPIMPPENQTFAEFRQAVEWARGEERLRTNHPMISNSMHAWYGTPALHYGWEELERRAALLASFEDYWHCNHNQYAAYWYQYRHAKLEVLSREGRKLRARLTRPVLRFLNDATPLTLAIRGVGAGAIRSIEAGGARVTASARRFQDRVLFHLHHAPRQRLPERVGHVHNATGAGGVEPTAEDPDFPGLPARLGFDAGRLRLAVANHTAAPLEELTVTYRLPLRWVEGVLVKHVDALPPGTEWTDIWQPTAADVAPEHRYGRGYAVAQLDFLLGGTPGRLYATCGYDDEPADASLPKGRFAILGPLAPAALAPDVILSRLDGDGRPPAGLPGPDGEALRWRANPALGNIPQEFLSPEVVRTLGDFYQADAPPFLLHSVVECDAAQPFRLHGTPGDIAFLIVNGRVLADLTGELRPGANQMIVGYAPRTGGGGRHAAAWIRLVDPETGRRLRSIRYGIPVGAAPPPATQDARGADYGPAG